MKQFYMAHSTLHSNVIIHIFSTLDLNLPFLGPNSIARCKIEPDRTTTGRYIVTYTPVEVGMYTVTIKWNDREVASTYDRHCIS